MAANTETTRGRHPIGLLVVHGIGRQRKGATAAGVVEGLQEAYPDTLRVSWDVPDHALVEGHGRQVHVLDVFWADLFGDDDVKGTFDTDRLFELVWFPGLNWKSGLLTAETVPRGRVRAWTAILGVLSPFAWCGLAGAGLIAAGAEGMRRERSEAWRARDGESFKATFTRRLHERDAPQLLDHLMDTTVGDVFNYVDGVGRAFGDEDPRGQRLVHSADAIRCRFEEAARRAVDDYACRELQVVAHSLGSVIAYRSLLPQADEAPDGAGAARLARIYTIGSPLAKVQFFWPGLLASSGRPPAITAGGHVVAQAEPADDAQALRWDNFYNRLDLVSGKLPGFAGFPAPVNHVAPALGGVFTAHVAYRANPTFLGSLGEGLGLPEPQAQSPRSVRIRHAVTATLQTVAAPLVFLFPVGLGLCVTLGMAWVAGWLVAEPFQLVGLTGIANGIHIYVVASVAFVVFIASAITGHRRAKEAHARFWGGSQRQLAGRQPARMQVTHPGGTKR